MNSRIISALASLLAAAAFADHGQVSIIPLPQQLERLEGSFKLTPRTRIYTDGVSAGTGEVLAGHLRESTGWHFKVGAGRLDSESAITGSSWMSKDWTRWELLIVADPHEI